MNAHVQALVTTVLLATVSIQAAPLSLYVSPDGKDAWSGRTPNANAAGTDGPFATLQRARDEIRGIKAGDGLPADGIIVDIRGGLYELGEHLEFTAQDSGTAQSPIEYRVRNGETARFLAGRVVSNFSPVTDPEVLEMLPQDARGHVLRADLRAQGITDYGSPAGGGMELFFRTEPMTLSRWPNDSFTRIVEMIGEAEKRGRHMTHRKGEWVYEGERPERWTEEKDPWVHGYWYHDWSDQRHPIKEIDTEAKTIEVKPPYHGYGYRRGKWYYAYNLLSEIDTPGEWYVDREDGILYFWPPDTPEEGDAIVSVLANPISLQDVSHLTIRGMLLEAGRGTAFSIQGGEKNRITACTIRNMGGWAVRVSGGKEHAVVGCDIYATGQGGIGLSGGDRKTLTPAQHVAENNHIHHYARIKRVYQPGITLSGVGNRASHNLIHNAPHMGMGFSGNDHVIEFNELHSVCYESNDAGAIYTGRNWTMRGNVLRHNYLHHISGFEGRGCVGVYLDDAFSSAAITGNVFYKVTRAAMIGGGRDNEIINNIFIDCVPAIHVDARGVGWANQYIVPGGGWNMQQKLADVPYKQEPWTKYPHLPNILEDEPYLPKYNVVARNLFIGGKWDGIRPKAKPYVTLRNNVIDPEADIVDADNGDLQLDQDSPAMPKDFEAIPLAEIGLYEDSSRATWPVTHHIRPMETPPPPPDRGPMPVFKVEKTDADIDVDGNLQPSEWNGLELEQAMTVEQGVQGEKLSPKTHAWAAHDGKNLYVGIRNQVEPDKRLRTEAVWGQNDAVEIAVKNPEVKGSSILVLRGYPQGQLKTSTDAGAPFEVSQDVERATEYAAKIVDKGEWTAEWRIPFEALGVDPAKHQKVLFNLSVRKTGGLQWMMWRGTLGHTYDVDMAGMLQFQ